MSDIDMYDATRKAFDQVPFFSHDLGSAHYFRKNPFLTGTINALSGLSKQYLEWLRGFMPLINRNFNLRGSLLPMLETMKNMLVGRVHDPHPYFIQRGIHSVTLMTHLRD